MGRAGPGTVVKLAVFLSTPYPPWLWADRATVALGSAQGHALSLLGQLCRRLSSGALGGTAESSD